MKRQYVIDKPMDVRGATLRDFDFAVPFTKRRIVGLVIVKKGIPRSLHFAREVPKSINARNLEEVWVRKHRSIDPPPSDTECWEAVADWLCVNHEIKRIVRK